MIKYYAKAYLSKQDWIDKTLIIIGVVCSIVYTISSIALIVLN